MAKYVNSSTRGRSLHDAIVANQDPDLGVNFGVVVPLKIFRFAPILARWWTHMFAQNRSNILGVTRSMYILGSALSSCRESGFVICEKLIGCRRGKPPKCVCFGRPFWSTFSVCVRLRAGLVACRRQGASCGGFSCQALYLNDRQVDASEWYVRWRRGSVLVHLFCAYFSCIGSTQLRDLAPSRHLIRRYRHDTLSI